MQLYCHCCRLHSAAASVLKDAELNSDLVKDLAQVPEGLFPQILTKFRQYLATVTGWGARCIVVFDSTTKWNPLKLDEAKTRQWCGLFVVVDPLGCCELTFIACCVPASVTSTPKRLRQSWRPAIVLVVRSCVSVCMSSLLNGLHVQLQATSHPHAGSRQALCKQ